MAADEFLLARAVSTTGVPAANRPNLLQREMGAVFAGEFPSMAATGSRPLEAEFVGYRGRRMQFAQMRYSPVASSSSGTAKGRPRLVLSLLLEGEGLVAQDGRERRVAAGRAYLFDPTRPFRLEADAGRVQVMSFPADALRALVPQVDGLTAAPFGVDEGAGSVFRVMFDELFRLAPRLTQEATDGVTDGLLHVLAAALATVEGPAGLTPSALRHAHKQRIRRFALDHLADPELDVAMVAEGVKLSPRYIHRLFADEPVTLMKWVWAERLERCRRELGTPSLRGRSVGEIAYGWGFNDLAHFSRAFRERFGLSPRQLRDATP
jgi:AraC-like DNA-binding protein